MADITPTDIVNKQFRLTMRGFDRTEVDDFLQQVSDSLYRALEENQRLRTQIEDLRGRLQHYQDTEDLIKSALMLAERTADETRQRAHQEADLIRREAETTLRTERAEMEELRQMRHRMAAELRAMLHAHLSLLDAQDGRPAPALSRGEAG
ncbi:MAG: DivIVA domain-containing protein [Armatimonadota bacterium]